MRAAKLFASLGFVFQLLAVGRVFAQGTAFTYQGYLKDSGVSANGSYEFRFRLATDASGTEYVGGSYLAKGISVTEGLFTTTMDFGPGVFTGRNYWLEVAVRTNGASTDYTVLSPLQFVAPAPYAIFAGGASSLSGNVGLAQLPTTVVTNGASSVSLSGVFSGDAAGLTNLFSPTGGDYLFAYANSGVQSNGTFMAFKYVIEAANNITFNSRGPSSDWTTASSPAGQVFVAAHPGVYWVQYTVCDTYAQGGGFPHFQATLNGARIQGSQFTPISQGHATTSFITAINAGDRLGIQCTPYAAQTLGTWNAGYFASLNILRLK